MCIGSKYACPPPRAYADICKSKEPYLQHLPCIHHHRIILQQAFQLDHGRLSDTVIVLVFIAIQYGVGRGGDRVAYPN
jgi:hypothetical protein